MNSTQIPLYWGSVLLLVGHVKRNRKKELYRSTNTIPLSVQKPDTLRLKVQILQRTSELKSGVRERNPDDVIKGDITLLHT